MRVLVALVLGGCLVTVGWFARADPPVAARPAPGPGEPDLRLRSLLGVRTMFIAYRLPAGEDHYVVELLRFEDGKQRARGQRGVGSVEGGGREARVELLWGEVSGKPAFGFHVADQGAMRDGDTFWPRLDLALAAVRGGAKPLDVYEGHPIVGFATSKVQRDGGEDRVGGRGFREALAVNKYVGAVSIRSFKTEEEARAAANK